MAEKQLYPAVQRWLAEAYTCVDTFVNRGFAYGRIDVSGLRHVGGQLSGRSEFVAVEVKTEREAFGTAIGQATGYSVYADRCYLAAVRPQAGFAEDEVMIADHLGVGLLHLQRRGRGASVSERLSAPQREPLLHLRARYIDNLGFVFCAICDSMFRRGDVKNEGWGANVTRQQLSEARDSGKGYVWWLHGLAATLNRGEDQTYDRRYLCADCVSGLFSETQLGQPRHVSE